MKDQSCHLLIEDQTHRPFPYLRGAVNFKLKLTALRVDQIREELEYGGLRLRTIASISGARIAVSVDVGFGDALEPGAEVIDYPSMLDLPMPRLMAYARETPARAGRRPLAAPFIPQISFMQEVHFHA